MEKLLIATHNPGKVSEFKQILAPKGIEVVSGADFDLEEPVEDGTTFEANALIKARAAVIATGLPALADDSGLCVNALSGDPGIYSARWAMGKDGGKDFVAAMEKINALLGDSADRSAYFIAVLALVQPDGTHQIFEGRCDGSVLKEPSGAGGFGYDPIFVPEGYNITFADMGAAEKHKILHRARAVAKFLERV